jgi:hypothetical protein
MMQQQQTYFFELYRASMRTATDIMKASLENAQRMQAQHMDAVRGAIEENAKSAQQLSEVKSLDEMMALQTRLAGSQLERNADLWSRMWRAAGDSQVAIIGQVQSQVGQLSDRVRETYQFSARTGEDATRFAASQTSATANSVRDAAQQEQARKQQQHQERKSA